MKDNLAEHAISLVNKVALISEIKGRRARNIIKAGIYMVLNHRTATRDPVVYRDLEVKMIFEHLFGTNPNEWESCYKALADGLI